jgi:glycosyltransferase involved in cell wall biosynthesis
MKVGVFLDEYIPEDGGGYTFQAEVLYALLRLAGESGHDFVLVSSQTKELAEQIAGSPVELLSFNGPGFFEKIAAFLTRNWPNLHNRLRWESSLEKRLRREGIDFVWFLSPRAQDIDLPYMTIVLDMQHRLQPWFPEVSRWGQWQIRERGFGRTLRRAAAIIAGNAAGQAEIERFYQVPAERIHLLPHPTPAYALAAAKKKAAAAVLERFALPKGYLLYPAQFWPHKNHMNLLLALKQLKDDGLVVPLVLVGADFGNQEFIEDTVIELGLGTQVHILGFVPQDELVALYQNALALSYLTLFGPENLPPMEAFALGTPVLASAVSGAQEQVGDAALLVDPLDPAAIAAAIKKLHGDKELRAKLVKRGKARAAKWTMDDFVKGAFQVLDNFAPLRRTWRD